VNVDEGVADAACGPELAVWRLGSVEEVVVDTSRQRDVELINSRAEAPALLGVIVDPNRTTNKEEDPKETSKA
jgi:hypothetical protein